MIDLRTATAFGALALALITQPATANAQPAAINANAAGPSLTAPSGAKLVMLGTGGGPVARSTRSQSASLLQVDGRIYLIDAGDGVSQALTKAGYAPADISTIFLTHLHFDHVAGLAPLIGFNWMGNAGTPIHIYGPPGLTSFAGDALKYLSIPEGLYASQSPNLKPIRSLIVGHDVDISTPTMIYQDDKVRVTAVENSHYTTLKMAERGPGGKRSYAYRFDTPDRSFVFTGDTGPSDAVAQLAQGADVLICEVLDPAQLAAVEMAMPGPDNGKAAPMAHMRQEHLTPEDVGRLATKAGVRMVILNHLISSGQFGRNAADLAQQVREHFKGIVVSSHDGDEL